MSWRSAVLPLLALVFGLGAAPRPDGAALVREAAQAMGGMDRVMAVRSLVMEGEGENPNLLQQMAPEKPLLVWMMPEWRRAIDFEHGRTALQLNRRPAFPAVFDNFRMDARLDGDTPWDVGSPFGGPAPPPRRAAAGEVRERRIAMRHHPLAILRAALAPGARVGPVRMQAGLPTVQVTTAEGDRLTVAFDPVSKLPVSVSSLGENVLLGDVATTTRFSGWEDVQPAGLRLPRRLVSTVDGWPEYSVGVLSNSIDSDVSDLAAPRRRAGGAAARSAPPQVISARSVGHGVWYLTAPGGYSSVLVEFADHTTLIEAPQGEARAQALFAEAHDLVPGKPLTQLVVSHFHVDHAAGFRAAVARGLTVVVQQGNAAFFRDAARRPHTLDPDALARHPRPLKLVAFEDTLTLKDGFNELRLLHARGSPHGDTLLMAYFPRDRLLAQADLYLPGSRMTPHAVAFARDIARRGLAVERHLPLHGDQVKTQAEFLALVADLEGGKVR